MTPMQHLWVAVFGFGPAIILGLYKQWWVGIVALVVTFVLSWILAVVAMMNISGFATMTIWAWIKPPIIAAAVLTAGWWLF
jgi:hypothetical protein